MSARGSAFQALAGIPGEMAERIRTLDWSQTPLGLQRDWTPALVNAVSLMLPTRAEIVMFWGPEYVALYNDAYAPTIGDKHPRALGRPARENWSELWDDLEPLLRNVRETGETFSAKDRPFYIERDNGKGETVYFDISYSAVRESDGAVAGVLCIVSETTRRVRDQIALRRSEEQLRLATENAGIGLWDINPEGGIALSYSRDSSPFVMPQDRRTPMEDFLNQLHPDDCGRVREAYEAARDPKARPMMDVEYRIMPNDDSAMRWVKVRGRGSFDAGGNCLRVSGTALDISRERETQEALARSEEQLRLATEHAEIGMWDVDNVANTLTWTREVRAAFGITSNATVTMEDFYNGLHPEDREATGKAFAEANDPDKRALYDVEYRTVGKEDRVIRWVHAKGRGVFDETGRCVRVTGTALDITRRKDAEEQMRHSEQLLRLATDNADIGTWDLDLVQGTHYSQPRVKAMFGLSPQENPSPDEYFAMVHKDDYDRVRNAFAAASDPAKRATYDVDYRVHGRDGVTRWVQARGRGVFAADGTCLRVVGTAMDITDRKAIEQRLHDLNETLEQRVAERTAALEKSQAALQQAQKMEAIGNLTGGIAHDFNNLLQGLTGSLDLIRRKPDNVERVQKWAEAGLQAAERGAKLTAQLLAFSRAQKMEMKPLHVPQLLENMRNLLGRTLGPSIKVVIDAKGADYSALGDETQLEMAILNLAINARDAMPPSGGTLSLRARQYAIADDSELKPGDYVELSVTDNGEGMAPDVIARAFDPFFTTKGVGKGTGLGLSQVYGMARQAGGTARIVSTVGHGTTVSIFLPATTESAVRQKRSEDRDVATAQAPAHILVVDDDPDVRKFLADSLDTLGYGVVAVESGSEGLEKLAAMQPDLMIVDYAMPGMTGAEFAARVRERFSAMPIVFASGYAETAALEHVQDEHTVILRKPFRLKELQDALVQALRR